MCIFSSGVFCGFVYAYVNAMFYDKACIEDSVTCIFVLFEDEAIASLMMVVTLQVSWMMSHLGYIISQVNDWQVNYS